MVKRQLLLSELQDIQDTPEEFVLVVKAGIEAFEHGRTRLELKGPGQVSVLNRASGEESTFQGDMPEDQSFDELMRLVPDVTSIELRERPGVPDEARYEFEVFKGREPLARMQAWDGQLDADPFARSLMVRLRQLVAGVTDNEVVL